MPVILIREEAGEIPAQGFRPDLSVFLGQLQDLMAGILNGPGLMGAHMPGLRGDDAFIVGKHRGNDHRVGLRPAHKKFHVRFFHAAGFADLLPGAGAVPVRSVAGQGLQVRLSQSFDDLRMGSGNIIALKGYHTYFLQQAPEGLFPIPAPFL